MTWEGPGFVDHHCHLLRVAAGVPAPYGDLTAENVSAWHHRVSERWSTPMDEGDRPLPVDDRLRGALERALAGAASLGLVQVTEAGMGDWALLEALLALRARGPLPVRVRLLVASGVADPARMARTGDPWLEVEGVKFYADGWLGSRTCALAEPFHDDPDDAGVAFLDADTLASRADPFAEAGMGDWAYFEALLGLRARGPLPVRVRLLVASGVAEVGRMAPTGDPWLEIVGVKFYADGWLGPRTAAMRQPYSDQEEGLGILFLDADTLARRADPFAEAGWTIATHAIGDRAIESVLDGYERLYGSDCATAAPRIEHAQVLAPDLVRRMAELGVVACVQPCFAVADADTARGALGPDRMEDAYRWDTLLDAGVPVLCGSDFPVVPLAPLVGLQCLLTGDHLDGRRAGAPTLSQKQALAVMTDAGAGTVVLSEDPTRVAEDEVATIEVVETRPTG